MEIIILFMTMYVYQIQQLTISFISVTKQGYRVPQFESFVPLARM